MSQLPSNDQSLPAGFEYLQVPFSAFLSRYPFIDRNVLLMMPFSTPATDAIFMAAERVIEDHGLIPIRADAHAFSPDLWWNVLTHMIGCRYGIAIYEPNSGVPFNPNVSIEAGFMLALDRSVLLLANRDLERLPVDFSGRVFRTFDGGNISTSVAAAISDWIERDISYFPYGKKKLIVFVSLGGTCRCVMAKAIFSDRLAKAKITTVVVEAAAVADPIQTEVSYSAIKALEEIDCDIGLQGHRPRKLSPYLQLRADLIVALTDTSLARAPDRPNKLIVDTDIFGRAITNPYPDSRDNLALDKYRSARQEIESAIDTHFDVLLELAGARPKL